MGVDITLQKVTALVNSKTSLTEVAYVFRLHSLSSAQKPMHKNKRKDRKTKENLTLFIWTKKIFWYSEYVVVALIDVKNANLQKKNPFLSHQTFWNKVIH